MIAAMVVLVAPPSLASTQQHGVRPGLAAASLPGIGYLRDGNGAGDAASPRPGVSDQVSQPLYAVGMSAGPWRWSATSFMGVSPGTFKYGPLENATLADGDVIYVLELLANGNMCMGNSGGAAITEDCRNGAPPRDQWVYDPPTGYWINVGRSNDQDNWEILCNPGGGQQLIVTTRDNCTDYHEEWSFKSG
jgi:hypothetical protein